jgi:hypothetical protein
MIDAVLERDAGDPALATIADAAVRSTLGAEQRAGLLPGRRPQPTSSRSRSALRTA